jgi:glucosamine 6-phosphate synthetase-like amidotransferase/phosphosugar isomerase protein
VLDIVIVACGSAYHVGMAAQYVMEDLSRVPVRVELASEFRYRSPILPPHTLVVIISQSGETADSLAALREAKQLGATTLAIVNVVGSSIAREADHVCYTLAGPEIAVATTKAYSTQLVVCYALGIQLALSKGAIDEKKYQILLSELLLLPGKMRRVLEDKERIQWFAAKYANAHDVFFLGRGIDWAISMEGSLKMKEISYIHSEAYAAGEMKHGTISLVEEGTLVIGILTQPSPVREDRLQYDRSEEQRWLSDGLDHLRKLQHRRPRRFHRLYSQDRSPLRHKSCHHPAATDGLLPQRRKRTGRRQTPEPGQERDGGVRNKILFCLAFLRFFPPFRLVQRDTPQAQNA